MNERCVPVRFYVRALDVKFIDFGIDIGQLHRFRPDEVTRFLKDNFQVEAEPDEGDIAFAQYLMDESDPGKMPVITSHDDPDLELAAMMGLDRIDRLQP